MQLMPYGHVATLDFFALHIEDVIGEKDRIPNELLAYSASLLAHYAQTSTAASSGVAMSMNLSSFLDNFVIEILYNPDNLFLHKDPELTEIAGGQSLLLTGFFRDNLIGRHGQAGIQMYMSQGQRFFRLSAESCSHAKRKQLLLEIADQYVPLATMMLRLNHFLRDLRYLIKKPI